MSSATDRPSAIALPSEIASEKRWWSAPGRRARHARQRFGGRRQPEARPANRGRSGGAGILAAGVDDAAGDGSFNAPISAPVTSSVR
jgi:hypothetical protein